MFVIINYKIMIILLIIEVRIQVMVELYLRVLDGLGMHAEWALSILVLFYKVRVASGAAVATDYTAS